MSTPYLFFILKDGRKNAYADGDKWQNEIMAIEPRPVIETRHYSAYKISDFWKEERIKQNQPVPNFDYVFGTDIVIKPRFVLPALKK